MAKPKVTAELSDEMKLGSNQELVRLLEASLPQAEALDMKIIKTLVGGWLLELAVARGRLEERLGLPDRTAG